jgi:hypothetical protein
MAMKPKRIVDHRHVIAACLRERYLSVDCLSRYPWKKGRSPILSSVLLVRPVSPTDDRPQTFLINKNTMKTGTTAQAQYKLLRTETKEFNTF